MSRLEEIISEYRKSKHLDSGGGDKRLLTCVSLVTDDKTSKVTSSLGARSEEVIPTSAAEAEALIENTETAQLKKCELFRFDISMPRNIISRIFVCN